MTNPIGRMFKQSTKSFEDLLLELLERAKNARQSHNNILPILETLKSMMYSTARALKTTADDIRYADTEYEDALGKVAEEKDAQQSKLPKANDAKYLL
jgi:hypothetical protein